MGNTACWTWQRCDSLIFPSWNYGQEVESGPTLGEVLRGDGWSLFGWIFSKPSWYLQPNNGRPFLKRSHSECTDSLRPVAPDRASKVASTCRCDSSKHFPHRPLSPFPSDAGFSWNNGTQSTMRHIKQLRSPNSSLLVFLFVYMLASCVPVNQWDLGVCLAQRWKDGID